MAFPRVRLIERRGKLASGRVRASPGATQAYFEDVVLPYVGDACLIWPFARDRDGYGMMSSRRVHRMVCEAVNGPPPTPGHESAHSCGRGSSGCVTPKHLRWATRAENVSDRHVHGSTARGSQHGRAKLTEAQARKIRGLRPSMSRRAIASLFGISPATVNDIDQRRTWAWLQD